MKILFISSENPFPLDHGHHIRTFQNLQTLAGRHEIYFVGFDQSGEGMDHLQELSAYCKTVDLFPTTYADVPQAVLAGKSMLTSEPFFTLKYTHPDALTRIHALLAEEHIDLLHLDILHIAHFRQEVPGIPAVLVNHNIEWLRMKRWADVETNPLFRRYLRHQVSKIRPYEYRTCGAMDCCIAVSETDRAVLSQHVSGGKIVCVPNGVDADSFLPSDQPLTPNSLVWTGAMDSPYNADGVDFFVDKIWPLLVEHLPDLQVTFVGKSPTRAAQNLAARHPGVRCTGIVDDVRPYVAEAAAFIAPLRSGSGTKIKVLNAMAQGKAVITTSMGAEGIDAQSNVDIMIADTPEAFAEKTLLLLLSPDIAAEMGQMARKVVESRYAWKVIEKETLGIYEQVYKKWLRRQSGRQ